MRRASGCRRGICVFSRFGIMDYDVYGFNGCAAIAIQAIVAS